MHLAQTSPFIHKCSLHIYLFVQIWEQQPDFPNLSQSSPLEVCKFPETQRTSKQGGLTQHRAVPRGVALGKKPDPGNAVLVRPLVSRRQLYRPSWRFWTGFQVSLGVNHQQPPNLGPPILEGAKLRLPATSFPNPSWPPSHPSTILLSMLAPISAPRRTRLFPGYGLFQAGSSLSPFFTFPCLDLGLAHIRLAAFAGRTLQRWRKPTPSLQDQAGHLGEQNGPGSQRTGSTCPRRWWHWTAPVATWPFFTRCWGSGSGLLREIYQVLKVGSNVYTIQAKKTCWQGGSRLGPQMDSNAEAPQLIEPLRWWA